MIYVQLQLQLLQQVLMHADRHKVAIAAAVILVFYLGAVFRWPRLIFGREWPLAYLIWPTLVISAMYLYAGAVDYFVPNDLPPGYRRAMLGWPEDVMFVAIIAYCLAFVKIKSLRVGRFVATISCFLYIWVGFLAWVICAAAVTGGRI